MNERGRRTARKHNPGGADIINADPAVCEHRRLWNETWDENDYNVLPPYDMERLASRSVAALPAPYHGVPASTSKDLPT